MTDRRHHKFVIDTFTTAESVDVCAEIMYEGSEGLVHSDVCMIHDRPYSVLPSYRDFLHKCLDEWLDNSKGTGMFWIGDPIFASKNFQD